MKVEPILHFGYCIVLFSVLLMLWVTYTSACVFDSSCTCSQSGTHLGDVYCHNGPVNIPYLNSTKIYTLALINNDLDYIQPDVLKRTGISKLYISDNPIYSLHEESLNGLERTLWELHITNCKLSKVPGNALRDLEKLRTLNLTGNEIMEISSEQLRGVSKSLINLILANNGLTVLPAGVFSTLQLLENLDLSGNALATFNPASFTPPPPKLIRLNLADNLFEIVPYKELLGIRTLRYLDLSFNLITRIGGGPGGGKLSLDSVLFDYNQITTLGNMAMSYFEVANKTSFRSNPITEIEENAFRGCRINELILAECHLSEINPESFNGLENTLQHLDLSGNNLTNFQYEFMDKYSAIRSLHLGDNYMAEMKHIEATNENKSNFQLLRLDMSGKTNKPVDLHKFYRLGHLKSLTLSRVKQSSLSADDLSKFSVELETLRIRDAGITALNSQLFKHTRGIKTLDFTDNNIESIDSKSFLELSQSLENLILTHAFGKKITNFPSNLFKELSALRILKVNHNGLKILPNDINQLHNLEIFHAHDNTLESLSNNLFQGSTHTKLVEINLAFNRIAKLTTGTFEDLEKLERLYLSDNILSQIDKGAFENLPQLTELWLRGNKLQTLPVEAFQNLPHLKFLDLAYNSLKDLNFASLEQVGIYGGLTLNVSHNSLTTLRVNVSLGVKDHVNTNIKELDFSFNNMTYMGHNYLYPVRDSLTHLYLGQNGFTNISRDLLPEMPHLQMVDLSYNSLVEVEYDTFRNVRNLQVIKLKHNKLQQIREGLFSSLNNLRRIDLSENALMTLKDATISVPNLAKMDISYNSLTRVPLTIFTQSAFSCLLELDVSNNKISVLPSAESFGRFANLRKLDVSNNRISEIGNSFSLLPHITTLNLADNYIHIGSKDFVGLEHSLQHLDLSNISVSYVPPLPLPSLLTLKMTSNSLTSIPPDLATNLSSLRYLDVSFNSLESVPNFPQLKTLLLEGNKIFGLYNNTFKNFNLLTELGIQHLPLEEFDEDALREMSMLKTLHISNYKKVTNFKMPFWVENNKALHTLHIEVSTETLLSSDMQGDFPYKVRHIMLSGKEVKTVPDYLLKGVRFPELKLTLRNTSVESIPDTVFALPHVRNISLDLYNNTLKSLGNPSNVGIMRTPRKTFLMELEMTNNPWTCDCQLGWVETWQRKKRQYYMDHDMTEDSRQAKCKNKQNKPLLNILKSDLECGWSGGSLLSPKIISIVSISFLSYFLSSLLI